MLSTTDLLAHALTGKENLEQCSTAELEQLVNRYPYFPVSRLLLARKKGNTETSSVYYYNPLWTSHWLKPDGDATIIPAALETLTTAPAAEMPAGSNAVSETIPTLPEIHQAEETPVSAISALPSLTEAVAETDANTESLNAVELSEHASAETETETATEQPLTIPSLKFEAVDPDKALLFEPYHTVDYFASQGIKNAEAEKPADNFGQQLRRFTDWLKVMKRLPVTELEKQTDPKAEQKVEQLAGQSLREKEVVTEAMAEVWAKQGNTAKAREIYTKLSLLDPSKSAYFAAKIDELK